MTQPCLYLEDKGLLMVELVLVLLEGMYWEFGNASNNCLRYQGQPHAVL